MALCTYSSDLVMNGFTVIDNSFFNEFLPQATGDDVKVFLFGLNLCANPHKEDNTLETMKRILSLTEDQIVRAFEYWQEMGLVQIVSKNPFEVRYLSVRSKSGSVKIRDKGKYADFNKQMQMVFAAGDDEVGRMITPNEYNEYYSFIEIEHFEPAALILIAKYCTKIKSKTIGYPYVLAVARDFANQGIKTCEAVDAKMLEQEQSSTEIKQVLDALGLKREADLDERNLYIKWTQEFGFIQGVIVAVAKSLKKKGGFGKLDSILTKYYEQKLFTLPEIEQFAAIQEQFYEIAKCVTKTLGVYYENLSIVVDTYVIDWTNKGFSGETLEKIAMFCFKQSIRTLDAMNVIVQKFYKLGIITVEALEQYFDSILKNDDEIKSILELLGIVRSVSSYDRDFYRTWKTNWNFSKDEIDVVAEHARGKATSLAYLNKIIVDLWNKGVHGVDQIKKSLKNTTSTPEQKQNFDYESRKYTPEQFSAFMDSLEDVEI